MKQTIISTEVPTRQELYVAYFGSYSKKTVPSKCHEHKGSWCPEPYTKAWEAMIRRLRHTRNERTLHTGDCGLPIRNVPAYQFNFLPKDVKCGFCMRVIAQRKVRADKKQK
jgi:hypothetical protein